MTFAWTAEAIALLRQCVDAKMSARETADVLGAPTRNVVMGKAFRLGLKFASQPHGIPPGIPRHRVRPKRRGPPAWHPKPPAKVIRPEPVRQLAAEDIPAAQRRALLELTNTTCRFPFGDPGTPGFFFCGALEANMREGRAYCRCHTAAARNRREGAG